MCCGGLDLERIGLKVLFILQNGEKRLKREPVAADNHTLMLKSVLVLFFGC